MEKDSKTTVAVERTTFTKLDRLAKANNVSKMEMCIRDRGNTVYSLLHDLNSSIHL